MAKFQLTKKAVEKQNTAKALAGVISICVGYFISSTKNFRQCVEN